MNAIDMKEQGEKKQPLSFIYLPFKFEKIPGSFSDFALILPPELLCI